MKGGSRFAIGAISGLPPPSYLFPFVASAFSTISSSLLLQAIALQQAEPKNKNVGQ